MSIVALLDHLQRQAANEVAFYPLDTLRKAFDSGQVRLSFENGEPCGYLWHGPLRAGRDAVIYQAVIHYDLRRRMHGAGLVVALAKDAEEARASGVRCRCRSDIDANDFWWTLGFRTVAVLPGGARRKAEVNVWRRPIEAGLWDDIIVPPSRLAEDRSGYDRMRRAGTLNAASRWAR